MVQSMDSFEYKGMIIGRKGIFGKFYEFKTGGKYDIVAGDNIEWEENAGDWSIERDTRGYYLRTDPEVHTGKLYIFTGLVPEGLLSGLIPL